MTKTGTAKRRREPAPRPITKGGESVIEAALRVIAREGFEGATVRAIAREAGCTTGVPMHHFPTKRAMLGVVMERIFGILDRGPMGRPPSADPLGDLRETLIEAMPRDEERRRAWRLWLHCAAQALRDPAADSAHRRRYAGIRAWLLDTVRRAQKAGQIRRGIDPATVAELLFSAADGIATHAVLEPEKYPERAQIEFIDRQLELLRNP